MSSRISQSQFIWTAYRYRRDVNVKGVLLLVVVLVLVLVLAGSAKVNLSEQNQSLQIYKRCYKSKFNKGCVLKIESEYKYV